MPDSVPSSPGPDGAGTGPGGGPAPDRPDERYWRRTLRFTLVLLAVWFVAGYVVAIVLAPALNQVDFLGGPLGFWVAQNGAIVVFWLLILVYAVGMNRLDREFGVHDRGGSGPSGHSTAPGGAGRSGHSTAPGAPESSPGGSGGAAGRPAEGA